MRRGKAGPSGSLLKARPKPIPFSVADSVKERYTDYISDGDAQPELRFAPGKGCAKNLDWASPWLHKKSRLGGLVCIDRSFVGSCKRRTSAVILSAAITLLQGINTTTVPYIPNYPTYTRSIIHRYQTSFIQLIIYPIIRKQVVQ